MEKHTTRLEGIGEHQSGWRKSPFGDPLDHKCKEFYYIERYCTSGPEDSGVFGPRTSLNNHYPIFIYINKVDAESTAAHLNRSEPTYSDMLWRVQPAYLIPRDGEAEAVAWLTKEGML